MKKILALSLALAGTLSAFAIVAKPGERTLVQPNGDTLTVRAFGDHRFHWMEDLSGNWIEEQADGSFAQVKPLSEAEIAAQFRASAFQQAADWKEAQQVQQAKIMRAPIPLNIAPRGLVILMNFKDVQFKSDLDDIRQMIKGDNYTRDYKFTYRSQVYNIHSEGSAKEYFQDQSMGQYNPQFEVLGPYTAKNNMSYYGGNNDAYAYKLIIEACQAADAEGVDFTKYDCDNDGYIDFVYVIYAGYGEADGGSSNTIWPHTSWVSYSQNVRLDGKKLDTYACGNEIAYDSKQHAGIGTFVHEFSHVLGLPDLYDTQGSKYNTMRDWDVMDAGPYNNSGNTPPAYSAYERFFCGWLKPTILNKPASPILDDLKESNRAYIITSSGESDFQGNDPHPTEFYMLENRQRTSWDEHLAGHGLMITRIRYSYNVWNANTVNNTSKMGVDLIEADGKASGTYGRPKDLFPAGSTEYAPYEQFPITDIREENGRIFFDFMGGADWLSEWATQEATTNDKKGRVYTTVEAVYDASGRLIATDFQVQDLAPGLYIIQVGDDGEGKDHHVKGVQIMIR